MQARFFYVTHDGVNGDQASRLAVSVSVRMGTGFSGQWEPAHRLRRETLLRIAGGRSLEQPSI